MNNAPYQRFFLHFFSVCLIFQAMSDLAVAQSSRADDNGHGQQKFVRQRRLQVGTDTFDDCFAVLYALSEAYVPPSTNLDDIITPLLPFLNTAAETLRTILNSELFVKGDILSRIITNVDVVVDSISFGIIQDDNTLLETATRELQGSSFGGFRGVSYLLLATGTCNGCPNDTRIGNQISRNLQEGLLDLDAILVQFNTAVASLGFGDFAGVASLDEIDVVAHSDAPTASPSLSTSPTSPTTGSSSSKKSKRSKADAKSSKRGKSAKQSKIFQVPNVVSDKSAKSPKQSGSR